MSAELSQDPCDHYFSEANMQHLVDDGMFIIENALPPGLIEQLRLDSLRLFSEGLYTKAGVGRAKTRRVAALVRSDSTYWWDPVCVSPLQQRLWCFVHGLRNQMNSHFFMGLHEAELHYAVYPEGAFYARHVDQFRGNNQRKISFVLFLNRTWLDTDGGHLRLYADDHLAFRDILPLGGSLAIFCSDRVLHEVLPTLKQRLTLTGWLKTRPNVMKLRGTNKPN